MKVISTVVVEVVTKLVVITVIMAVGYLLTYFSACSNCLFRVICKRLRPE